MIVASTSDITEVTELFFRHGVVVMRDIAVTTDVCVALGEMFGAVLTNDMDHAFAVQGDSRLLRVTNRRHDDKPMGLFGNNDLEWHNDYAHSPGDFHGTLLYNELGGSLAETIFCDTVAAYADLEDDIKSQLTDVVGRHRVGSKAYRRELSKSELRLLRMRDWKPTNAEYSLACVHDDDTLRPVVAKHPVTGRSALYLGPATWNGSDPVISADLYDSLIQHCSQEKYIYRHQWASHDLVLFDNLSTMHRRGAFDGDRILWRLQFDYGKHLAR